MNSATKATVSFISTKQVIVKGVWEVVLVERERTQLVMAATPLEAAAKVVDVGTVLELSGTSVNCANDETRLVYVTEPEPFADFGGTKLTRIYVKPLLVTE